LNKTYLLLLTRTGIIRFGRVSLVEIKPILINNSKSERSDHCPIVGTESGSQKRTASLEKEESADNRKILLIDSVR